MNGQAWLLLLLLDALGSMSTPTHAASEHASRGGQTQSSAVAVNPMGSNRKVPAPPQKVECRRDLECWGARFEPHAQQSCAKGFDDAALWDARWWSLWDGEPVTHVRWRSRAKGVLEYYLDHDRTRLLCVFDPAVPEEVQVMYFPRDKDKGISLPSFDTGKATLSAGH